RKPFVSEHAQCEGLRSPKGLPLCSDLVCMLLKVFHSHCSDNLLVKLMILMLWLCIRSPGYCSQVVPYAYLGILRGSLPIHKMLQCAALVLPIVLKLCSNTAQLLKYAHSSQ